MSRQDSMGTFTAHRERRAFQMTDALLQYRAGRPVENRQVDIDGGDLDVPHNPVLCHA